jgi:hypothetical protein
VVAQDKARLAELELQAARMAQQLAAVRKLL